MRYKLCTCGAAIEDRAGVVCERCGRGRKRAKQKTAKAGYDWQWQQLSVRYRKENPLCAECAKQGIAMAAEEVHHIVPIGEAPWLRLSVGNLVGLCVPCHRRIDQARREGVTR